MKKLNILDGSWYIFRAYYALPKLTNEEWENINAIYGFFRMLFSILKEKPDYLVIAWDSPKPSIRKKIFPEYKANRPKLPDNFKWQLTTIHNIIEQINIPALTIPWYEADDIIYSLVNNLASPNITINILSADKDLLQFLEKGNITITDPQRLKKINQLDFIKKYWFKPQYIVDFLALVWDSSDNIPWVRWIWKNTATELIKKFWTIENIYNNLDKLDPKIKTLLEKWKEDAFKSKKLIKLIQIPEIKNINIENFKINPNFDKIKEILIDKFHFKSLEKTINELKKIYSQNQLTLF